MSWYRFHATIDGTNAASILHPLGFRFFESSDSGKKIYVDYNVLAIECAGNIDIWSEYRAVIDPLQKRVPGASEVETVTIS